MKYKILIVDDEPANLRMLERLFQTEHEVITAGSGAEALGLLARHNVALIISDQRMPGMTGIEFLQQAAKLRPQTTRVVLTGYTDAGDLVEAINCGVIYRYITKPWVNADLQQMAMRALEHYETTKKQHLLTLEYERLEKRVSDTVNGFVHAIGELATQDRPGIEQHCRRVADLANDIGLQLGLETTELEQLRFASLLHEVPNARMPFDMAISRTALNRDQYRTVQNSYESALRLIAVIPDLEPAAEIIRYQHERYDGSGFFDGLDRDKTPLSSRILAVANAFDELSCDQPLMKMPAGDEIADALRRKAGRELDPEVVEACLASTQGHIGMTGPNHAAHLPEVSQPPY